MILINADVFLQYLIFSKHIDSLKCGDVKEAVEMSKVDVFDKIRAEIEQVVEEESKFDKKWAQGLKYSLKIIDKYMAEGERFNKDHDDLDFLTDKEKIVNVNDTLDEIRTEIEQLPTKTRTNWDGCCPDFDYPEIEYVDVTKKQLLEIIDKYKGEKNEMSVSDKSNT